MADNENKVDETEVKKTEQQPEQAEVQAGQTDNVVEAERAEAKAETASDKAAKAPRAPKGYTPRLRADYDARIVAAMIEKFGYKNKLEVPRLEKIVINMGVGEATQDKKRVETAAAEMQAISGQKPVI